MKRLILIFALFTLLAVPALAQLPGLPPPHGEGGPDQSSNYQPPACDTCDNEEQEQNREEWAKLAKSIQAVRYTFPRPNNLGICNAVGPHFAPEITWTLDSGDVNPDNIRVSWRFNKGWPSIKDANTAKRGNAMLSPDTDRFTIPIRAWPTNKDLRVRVRQVYKGEKSGEWKKIVIPWPCDY